MKKIKKTFHILTLFPKMFEGPFSESIIKRAEDKGIIDIKIYNLREWGRGKHKQVDDTPYGGGAGMVMKVDVIDAAVKSIKKKIKGRMLKTILLTPQGNVFNQNKSISISRSEVTDIILICGHYEGFDERIRDLVDEEISIGDYILTGGEIPAMVLVDSITRLIPGTIGKKESFENESFSIKNTDIVQEKGKLKREKKSSKKLLEYPQYTRPEDFNGKKVPEILFSGNHKKIREWREKEAYEKTKKRRKDLLD